MRELTRAQVVMALAAAGFNEADVQLDAPDVVIIKRASQQVDLTLVRDAVERATLGDLQANGATARLARLDLPPMIEVPAGKVEARAAMANVRDLYAPFTVFIELWMEGRIVHRLSATAQVEAFAPVLVAARTLAAGTRLRPDAVTTAVRRLNRPLTSYVLDPGRLRGMAVREAVARGEAITTELMLAEYVVKPGDQVRVVGESSDVPTKVQIVVNGEARTAGRVGDRVQVKNLQSGNLLQAVVVDEGLVRVKF
jgi:flagella basal body P-ring formation protein FlgA